MYRPGFLEVIVFVKKVMNFTPVNSVDVFLYNFVVVLLKCSKTGSFIENRNICKYRGLKHLVIELSKVRKKYFLSCSLGCEI